MDLTRRFDKTPVPDDIVSRIVKRIDLCPNAFGPHVVVLGCFHYSLSIHTLFQTGI